MDGIDPDTLLEWLQTGVGDERDLQLMALEHLCMTLLMSDNIDRCFESCPPRTFLPALGRIFLDETAPENILEVTARAITYYLDVSNECTRRITQVDGAVKAICHRLVVAEMTDRTSKDLAEQCVKLLEHICQREATAVYDAGGLQAMLHMIQHHDHLHKDTMHSAMAVITKLCAKMEPNDPHLPECSKDLGKLLGHDDEKVAECALRCFSAMTDRFIRRQMDPIELARPSNLVAHLLDFLIPSRKDGGLELVDGPEVGMRRNSAFVSTILSLIINLCKGSPIVTNEILHSPKLVPAFRIILRSKDERCINDCLRLIDLLIVLFCEGRSSIPKFSTISGDPTAAPIFDKTHRNLIDAIRQRDTDALIDAVENGTVNPDFVDDVGQTLLNWCSAFGTSDMVIYLCDKGADPNKGQRSSSLHYASCFGRAEIVKILLRYGANPDQQDEEGRTALDKARERSDEGHQQVCEILQNPGAYMIAISSAGSALHHRQKQEEKIGKLKNSEQEKIDHKLAENFIKELLPVFCFIYKNSFSASIRRTTLTLIRKCIFHITNEGLFEMIELKEQVDSGTPDLNSMLGISGFVEHLVGVLMVVFENSEENVDSREQALMIIKSLLLKNSKFWVEQLVRLGVYEKIEQLVAASAENTQAAVPQSQPSDDIAEQEPANVEGQKKDELISRKLNVNYDRSGTSTPSISLRSDSTAQSSELSNTDNESVHLLRGEEVVSTAESSTPSPTCEIVSSYSATQDGAVANGDANKQPSVVDSPPIDSDLLEAATTIAQALGVQIIQDAAEKTEEQQTAATGDAWCFEPGNFYRWRDWRLIRSKDSLFVWCDAVAMELSDGSNGWLRFFMNGRLSTLYSSGSPEYGADNADTRAEFVDKLQKAKDAVPPGAQTKSVFSVPSPPSAKQQIETGNWILNSPEADTLIVTNREGTQQKLSIKEDLPGFMFESSRQHKQLFTAESTLGHNFVTGWAARGGGRRLRFFKVEVQKQKVVELAKEIWDNYLREARDKPRDVVLQIQKCSERLGQLLKENEILNGEKITKKDEEEIRLILVQVKNALSDDRLLSIFEISITGLIPSLLEFINCVQGNSSGFLAKLFTEVFADPKDLEGLVRKIVMVLELVEKFPQYLYDTPGGSPFGFHLLTRRLRFRFELEKECQKEKNAFIDITNRFLKSEPLVTVIQLKNYIYDFVSNPKNTLQQAGTSSTSVLTNLHYTRPPTAASLRVARKLKFPKSERASSSSSSTAMPNEHGGRPQTEALLSARSAYMAAGCLEKIGNSVKVKQPGGRHGSAAGGSKSSSSKKQGSSRSAAKTIASSRSQRTSNGGQRNGSNLVEKPSEGGNIASMNSTISQQQQKSMSTTNLFDADQHKHRSSSVAFNQAASAESLQHQTPSLENLLSKARLHDYSIPEESLATPNSGSPEPKNFPTFDNIPRRFEKRKGSENSQSISIGASSFAGGSQPVLSFSRDKSQTVDSSAEKLSCQNESSIETINESTAKENASELLHYIDEHYPGTIFEGLNAAENVRQEKEDEYLDVVGAEEQEEGDEDDAESIIPGIKESDNIFNFLPTVDDISQEETAQNEGGSGSLATAEPIEDPNEGEQQIASNSAENSGESGPGHASVNNEILGSLSIPTNHAPGNSTNMANIGSNIRLKLGNYADFIKHMVHQVFESGDGSDLYEGDDYDNDIYEDEILSQYLIEEECEPQMSDPGFNISSDSSSIAGFIGHHHHQDAANAVNSASQNVANVGCPHSTAMAAIRAARNDGILPAYNNKPIDTVFGSAASAGDQKQRWRQMLVEELTNPSFSSRSERAQQRSAAAHCDCGKSGSTKGAHSGGGGGWNDDFILRRQFSALIPAFDPRPGRTNVNQIQEVELSDILPLNFAHERNGTMGIIGVAASQSASQKNEHIVRLFLKRNGKEGQTGTNELIELKEDQATLFYYVQQLLIRRNKEVKGAHPGTSLAEMNAQVWDNTFTLIYNVHSEGENSSYEVDLVANREMDDWIVNSPPLVKQTLELTKVLFESVLGQRNSPMLTAEMFNSPKLTQKLCQELTDPLVISSNSLPKWCNFLVYNYPCLFSLKTRIMYMNTTAFGTSRAIGYLQGRRDQLLEQNRPLVTSAGSNMAGLRREDHYPEFRIGRIKHERIKVHRSEELFLESAIKVLKFHATRKTILEIEYYGEEGTGLGPTLEFFALIASEFQRSDLCMWFCDDSKKILDGERAESSDYKFSNQIEVRPPCYYVHTQNGLFPAPYPLHANERVLDMFRVFGVFLAKAIQDDRLVDLPLSPVFLKLILSSKLVSANQSLDSVLDINDLAQIYPEKAKLLKSLIDFSSQRRKIEANSALDDLEKVELVSQLRLKFDGSDCSIEDLAITFAVSPPSARFPYKCAELVPDGLSVELTAQNTELYVQTCLDYYLNSGIREQLFAFRMGFDSVFPLSSLAPFSTAELQTILSGEQFPRWSREDLLRYTEPKLGYTRDSSGFLNFVEVLTNFGAMERKAFLQFATGCSSLPPGGLANLHPRLTIVRKVGSGDGSYPSVNTCVHYLKLPEYSSVDILRERLLAATFEKGFHLN